MSDNPWRPIDTAPRDGTWVLAHRAGTPDHWLTVVSWRRFSARLGGATWRDRAGAKHPHVTHWMPLPEQAAR